MTTYITECNQRFAIELKNFCQLEIDIMVPDNFRRKFFGLCIIYVMQILQVFLEL